jgi:hypothetical protein
LLESTPSWILIPHSADQQKMEQSKPPELNGKV